MIQTTRSDRHVDNRQTGQLAEIVNLRRPERSIPESRVAVPGSALNKPAPEDARDARILVVDDEPALAELISRVLTDAGFQVIQVGTGAAALTAAAVEQPDLIILDLMLPDMRGEDVLTTLLAARPGRRIFILSAVTQIATRVGVLTNGAVDYMAKPFANSELVARVRARMREPEIRSPETPPHEDQPPRLADYIQLDLNLRRIIVDGNEIRVTPTEFLLLSCLLRQAPAVCSRDELLASMGGTAAKKNNLVEVHISRLRAKLAPIKIETVRNEGYRIVN